MESKAVAVLGLFGSLFPVGPCILAGYKPIGTQTYLASTQTCKNHSISSFKPQEYQVQVCGPRTWRMVRTEVMEADSEKP